ncbi:hypothetical protein BOBR111200_05830 [Bordetella bronchialis]
MGLARSTASHTSAACQSAVTWPKLGPAPASLRCRCRGNLARHGHGVRSWRALSPSYSRSRHETPRSAQVFERLIQFRMQRLILGNRVERFRARDGSWPRGMAADPMFSIRFSRSRWRRATWGQAEVAAIAARASQVAGVFGKESPAEVNDPLYLAAALVAYGEAPGNRTPSLTWVAHPAGASLRVAARSPPAGRGDGEQRPAWLDRP